MTIRYEEFLADVQRRKRERWARILAAEGPGRVPGRRPRDPESERLQTEMDRRRLATMEERLGITLWRSGRRFLEDLDEPESDGG